MFYLAWQACGGLGMGWLQDRGDQSEDSVWEAIVRKADYPGMAERHPHKLQSPYADYVFGRMMKMGFRWTPGTLEFSDGELRIDYEAWCGRYPSYQTLAEAAADQLGMTVQSKVTA